MNALTPLVYTGRRDLGPDHVRAILDDIRWKWEFCHFQHILDWEDWKMEQAAIEDERRADEQYEAERAGAYLSCPVSHQMFSAGE